MDFKVSVVIPVYNAALYVRKSVESALLQQEVEEVLLIEDGSKDDSLEVCLEISKEFGKVRLLQHEGRLNRGAGASRNLGMREARNEYIAFLDADDYFFPNRFETTKQVFSRFIEADGVYDAVGIFKDEKEGYKLYSMSKAIAPNRLFYFLLRGKYGHFSTNGLTIQKKILNRSGIFNTTLKLHQDTELWLRFAFWGKLYPGKLDLPVTFVRRHMNNRIIHADFVSRLQLWQAVINYFALQPIRRIDYLIIFWKFCKMSSKVHHTSIMREIIKLWQEDRSKVIKLVK